ncbi:MAG: hypothetical protein Q9162_003338 [Coniocarpon cinnabarinum]
MEAGKPKGLQQIELAHHQHFLQPTKRINVEDDVRFFLLSRAYTDIVTFILQLNASLFPTRVSKDLSEVRAWELGNDEVPSTSATLQLSNLLSELNLLIAQAPPDQGPRRFGNVAFRKWFSLVEEKINALLEKYLTTLDVTIFHGAQKELKSYFLGSFGSAQRLDYGTGHELSFFAFLAALWKLGAFKCTGGENDLMQERAIVLHVFEPYLKLVRRLIITYTLEPAGSHGVWGLDDHSFLPYLFGSAQLGPPVSNIADTPQEGSLSNAPEVTDVTKAAVVERERNRNMYFSAIGFIYDVKKGPFWEHSPMLYDISGIRAGWAKVNKDAIQEDPHALQGMIKMYVAEVLSKFPVVQHFPFGSIFTWERDPNAFPPPSTPHISNSQTPSGPSALSAPTSRSVPSAGSDYAMSTAPTRAPWASTSSQGRGESASASMPSTKAPWAKSPADTGLHAPARAPWTPNR